MLMATGCATSARTAVTATVNTLPTPTISGGQLLQFRTSDAEFMSAYLP